jgi:membrane protein DedA with SNARE-associated domain
MQSVWSFLANNPIGAALRVFAGVVLGYFVLDLGADGEVSVSADDLNAWIAAGLVVAVPIIIALINPADTRFGRGSGGSE